MSREPDSGAQSLLAAWAAPAPLSARGPLSHPRRPARRFFRANLERNVFHCFACPACGNVLTFVAAMERCSIREALSAEQQNVLLQYFEPIVLPDQLSVPAIQHILT